MNILKLKKLVSIFKLCISIFICGALAIIQARDVFALPESIPTYELKWGSAGSGQGQFTSPLGIAVSREDKVYISETSNHRVQVFDLNGNFLFQIGTGSAGVGTNEFTNPQGLAIDHTNGWLYVVDNGTGRIKKLDLNGNHVATFTEPPDADDDDGGLDTWSNASFITVDQATNIVMLGIAGEGRIDALTSSGGWVWSTAFAAANSPRGMGILGSELFVVSQNLNYINVFNKDTGALTRFIGSGTGSGNGQLSSPRGLTIDYEGYIYVADMGNARVQKFDRYGNYLAQFGTSGTGDGQFTSVYNVMFDPDGYILYTSENAGARIQKFVYTQLPIVSQPGYSQPIPQSSECSISLVTAPEFFRVERDGAKATLYFTPILNIESYILAYGDEDSTDDYGTTFTVGWTDGVQQYTVEKLNPNKKYSFKLAGQNGCATGTWSHTLRSQPTQKLADTGVPVMPITTLATLISSMTLLNLYRMRKDKLSSND